MHSSRCLPDSDHLSTNVLFFVGIQVGGKAGLEGVNEFSHFLPTQTTPFFSTTWLWGQRKKAGLKVDRVKRK